MSNETMSDNKANEIIAEYMGEMELAIYYPDQDRWDGGHSKQYTIQKQNNYYQQGLNCELRERPKPLFYTDSLDELVPVWERLGKRDIRLAFRDFQEVTIGKFFGMGYTIQQASARATAKIILELRKNEA